MQVNPSDPVVLSGATTSFGLGLGRLYLWGRGWEKWRADRVNTTQSFQV